MIMFPSEVNDLFCIVPRRCYVFNIINVVMKYYRLRLILSKPHPYGSGKMSNGDGQ